MFNKRQRSKPDNVACVFVHAGAGYHSEQNEATHLQACHDAARSAMAVLRAGGSAVDAVEIAVKVLEDREVTNAGYGSNLTMDGVVECDAVIVDHNGRSGGAGAVSQIKNPVSLARLLLDLSATELSLRRVPPNFLVGQGATDFAWSHGISIVPHDLLISPNARSRWTRWKADLRAAAQRQRVATASRRGLSPSPEPEHDLHWPTEVRNTSYRGPLEESLFNDAQPISPPPSDTSLPSILSGSQVPPDPPSRRPIHNNPEASTTVSPERTNSLESAAASPLMTSAQGMLPTSSSAGDGLALPENTAERSITDHVLENPTLPSASQSYCTESHVCKSAEHEAGVRSSSQSFEESLSEQTAALPDAVLQSHTRATMQSEECRPGLSSAATSPTHNPVPKHTDCSEGTARGNITPSEAEEYGSRTRLRREHDIDQITDTVGAIAIDLRGNIACGASSGGIGMKYRGRVGPAALVGVGACVLPAQGTDPSRATVATVTSGTGEHMATTQAASVCSSRIYFSQRRSAEGALEDVTEDEAMRDFIEKDFMAHSSVTHSRSAGAIGALSVKMTQEGAWLYFAHNTDSFALGSMSSTDAQPVTTMSRNKGGGRVAGGGRAIRFARRSRAQQSS